MRDNKTVISIKHRSSQTSGSATGEEETFPIDWETFLYKDPSLQKYGEGEAVGYGVERCLYELNPELACLSPCLIHARVLTPADALIALEDVAAQPNRPAFPVDRHLAAFFISRWKEMNFIDLRDMGKPQREVKNLALLKILASIQSHFKVKGLPHLCQWMAELCSPIITHYHNLKARAKAQEDITKAVSSGQLFKLVQVLENRQALVNDECDYHAAKIEVLLIESEIKEIERKIVNRNQCVSRSHIGIWEMVFLPITWLRNAHIARQGKRRMTKLYEKSESLRETWGEGLMPRGKNPAQDFWGKLWTKMNSTKSLQPKGKSPIRYN
jgi:hypothetical protein